MDKMQGIYAITPDRTIDKAALHLLLKKGVCALQYRRKQISFKQKVKEAEYLRKITAQYEIPLIINDDIDLCLAVAADGVHLGRNDSELALARVTLGWHKIIGISCYNDLERGLLAEAAGANYLAFGTLFASKTKPFAKHCPLRVIAQAKQRIKIAIVCIGGINSANKTLAMEAGCDAVAMISALAI